MHRWQSQLGVILGSDWWRRRVLAPEIREAHRITHALGIIRARWPTTNSVEAGSTRPIFILSAGWGSGSTLVQRLIVSSGNTMIWGEPLDHAVPVHRLAQMLIPVSDNWPRESYFQVKDDAVPLQEQWIANITPPIDALRAAHRSFVEAWLRDPAMQRGYQNWGFKDVRLTADHARYLRWLFPDARIIFIYRDVLDSFRSCKGVRWLSVWPDHPVAVPSAFAHHWKLLLSGFLESQKELDALLIRYEDLAARKLPISTVSDFLEIGPIDETILDSRIGSRRMQHASLSNREKLTIRSITDELRVTLGYE